MRYRVFGLKQTIGAPVEIRTPDPWLRRPILYPLSYRRFPITVIHYTPFMCLSRFMLFPRTTAKAKNAPQPRGEFGGNCEKALPLC